MIPAPLPIHEAARIRTGRYASDASFGLTGAFQFATPYSAQPLRVIASDGDGWEHVSVSMQTRCPTWDEMCWIKDRFWLPEEEVFQFHPPRSEYVNHHPFCLHLWRPIGRTISLPPSILVGPK